jgi:hypothetical protein
MDRQAKNGVIGLALVGAGAVLTAVGFVLVMPLCVSWSRTKLTQVYNRGKEGVISGFETAAEALKVAVDKAQPPLSDVLKAAKDTTAVAAGAVESAAHYVREHVS